MNALIVDDSGTTRRIIAGFLVEAGFQVDEAADGSQGLEKLRHLGTPDLVVVDWNMPELDGLGFVKAVRAEARWKDVRLLMATTEAEKHKIILALEAGANEYVMKPFTREMFLEKLALLGIGGI